MVRNYTLGFLREGLGAMVLSSPLVIHFDPYEHRYLLSKLLFTLKVSVDLHSRRQQLTGYQQIAQSKERHDLRSVLFKLPTMDGLVSELSLGNRVRVPYYYIVWKPTMVMPVSLFPHPRGYLARASLRLRACLGTAFHFLVASLRQTP